MKNFQPPTRNMKAVFGSSRNKQSNPQSRCQRSSAIRLLNLFCAVYLSFFICMTLARAQSCPDGPGCQVQYKVTYANLSKDGFDEYTNVTLPRIHIYHHQITHEYYHVEEWDSLSLNPDLCYNDNSGTNWVHSIDHTDEARDDLSWFNCPSYMSTNS